MLKSPEIISSEDLEFKRSTRVVKSEMKDEKEEAGGGI